MNRKKMENKSNKTRSKITQSPFTHEELNSCGLEHGKGAICCGCAKCHCYEHWLLKRGLEK